MDGRVAIVTGASRGIGRRIAERFAGEGAAVALVARTAVPGTSSLPGSLEEVANGIRAHGGRAEAVPADLTVPKDIETVVARATEALGPVDTLVNNAGVNFYGPALDIRGRRGADHVLFGSDYPHPEGLREPRDYVGRLDGCGVAVTRGVLRGNTANLLGLLDHGPTLAG
jgi:NAD(P)-dependent dehydrogenase (short-subunit alcohol dehydrogenase family)